MHELSFPEEGRTVSPSSDHSKKCFKCIEAFELLKLTKNVQCAHCRRSRDIRSHLWLDVSLMPTPHPVSVEQIRRNVKPADRLARPLLSFFRKDQAEEGNVAPRTNSKQETEPNKLLVFFLKKGYTSILDRWRRTYVYRASQLNVGWTEKQVKQMDPLAPEGDTNHATKERYKQIWMLKGNTDGYAREGTSHINRITVLLFKKTHQVSPADPSAPPNIPRPKPQQKRHSQQRQGRRIRLQENPDSN